jgi:hypothetical protein
VGEGIITGLVTVPIACNSYSFASRGLGKGFFQAGLQELGEAGGGIGR